MRDEHKKPRAYWPLFRAVWLWTKEEMKIKTSYNYLGQKWQVYNIGEGALQSWTRGRCSWITALFWLGLASASESLTQ